MLIVFPPIFVADTKIVFRYDFVAPLSNTKVGNVLSMNNFCWMKDWNCCIYSLFLGSVSAFFTASWIYVIYLGKVSSRE